MNFKIEHNYLDITNYPSIERHLEKMASKGWLIHKIIAGSIFIYRKIKPEILDFSISPYEVETAFTRKSKEELEEFNSVCESVGWNYATKSYDLHIYFKDKNSEAMDIQTDEEEEFRTLEFIGKKYLKSSYIQIPLLLFFSWLMLGNIFTNIDFMKSGSTQIIAPLIPVGILVAIMHIIHIKKFLKMNRKNMELGKAIEFSDSKFYINRVAFLIINMTLFVLLLYAIYSIIFLRDKFILIGFIPTLIGLSLGFAYRIYIKPAKRGLRYKIVIFALTIAAASFFSIAIFRGTIIGMVNSGANKTNANLDSLKVLTANDFVEEPLEEDGDLRKQASILIPTSYEYSSYSREYILRTEYSNALTEALASNLAHRYIKQAENALTARLSERIELFLEEGISDDYLLRNGLTREELDNLEGQDTKDAVEAAMSIIKEKSIVEDMENPWKADEAYFLNYERTELVLRNGKEVFYLDGLDFSDDAIIEIVKDRLMI